jgi:hypothetical protein
MSNLNHLPPSHDQIIPPLPPPNHHDSPCTFEYLSPIDKLYVTDAYEVISRNEWWGPFRTALLSRGVNNDTGFMFNTDPLCEKIMDAISSTQTGAGHSGFSITCVMWNMKFIALNGEPAFREYILKQQREKH